MVVAGLLAAVAGVVVLRTVGLDSAQIEVPRLEMEVDAVAVATRMGEAVRFRTVSNLDTGKVAWGEFERLHAWMQTSWPAVHSAMQRETVGGYSLLYHVQGSDPALAPVLLMAHQDVVPVEPGTEGDWIRPPFAGDIAPCGDIEGDCVWGRGTLDVKSSMVGIMEAAEPMFARGWQPQRTVYFFFGHDEEVGGGAGARAGARLLEDRGVRLAWVLDEGLVVTDGMVEGLDQPVAMIGTAEKGYLSLELVATDEGGHSSMPPLHTAAGRVARAVTRLEANQFPGALDGAAGQMFAALAPYLPLGQRAALANLWLAEPLVVRSLESNPLTASFVRTTTAATMLKGSVKENVLPQRAVAVVNFRVHPRDSVDSVTERVRRVIDDGGVEVRPVPGGMVSEPSPVSSTGAAGYLLLERSIKAVWPRVLVAPGIVVGATDSRHFAGVADNVYRFIPFWMRPGDRSRVHGTNERVTVDNLADFVRFYSALLGGVDEPAGG